jgi:hypothetical protein
LPRPPLERWDERKFLRKHCGGAKGDGGVLEWRAGTIAASPRLARMKSLKVAAKATIGRAGRVIVAGRGNRPL